MKLLILSDSHGEQEFMQLAVRRERPDAVIHLGDHCADADRLAEEFCGLPVLSVRGNCDLWGPAPFLLCPLRAGQPDRQACQPCGTFFSAAGGGRGSAAG